MKKISFFSKLYSVELSTGVLNPQFCCAPYDEDDDDYDDVDKAETEIWKEEAGIWDQEHGDD